MPSVAASAPSSSGAVDAPVHTLMANSVPAAWAAAIRAASAVGTALGYPAPVNPLMPTWAPGGISAAASSALVIRRANVGDLIRVRCAISPPASPSCRPLSYPDRDKGQAGGLGRQKALDLVDQGCAA